MVISDYPLMPTPHNDRLFKERQAERDRKKEERFKLAKEGKKGSKGVLIFNPYFKCENVASLKLNTAVLESTKSNKDDRNLLIMAKQHKFREDLPPIDPKNAFVVG